MRQSEKYKVDIFDAKGDLSKRWHVKLKYYAPDSSRAVIFRYYGGINRQKQADKRTRELNKLLKSIKKLLADGWKPERDLPETARPLSLFETIDETLALKATTLRPSTVAIYKIAAEKFKLWAKEYAFAVLEPDKFTRKDAKRYWEYLQKTPKISNTTRNTYLKQLSNTFGAMVERELIDKNPFAHIRRLPERHRQNVAYTDAQRLRLISDLRASDAGLYRFVSFMYYCFIRPGELCQLRIRDVNLKTGRIFLAAQITKNGREGHITIPAPLLAELKTLDLKRYDPDWFWFSNDLLPGETHLQRDAATKRHARFLKRMKVAGGCNLYSWKHTGVIAVVRAGANIKDVQNHLRHSSLEMVAKYLRSLGLEASNQMAAMFPEL